MSIEKCKREINPYEWYVLEALQQKTMKEYFPLFQRQCISLLKSEWPNCDTARLCPDDESDEVLPVSLILNEYNQCRQSCYTVGHCRLVKVISPGDSILVESVLVKEDYRGCGLGRMVMELTETCCKKMGYNTIYLVVTGDTESFYKHLGYTDCSPVQTIGAQMLGTCDMVTNDEGSSSEAQSCSGPSECKKGKYESTKIDSTENKTDKTNSTCKIWMKKIITEHCN